MTCENMQKEDVYFEYAQAFPVLDSSRVAQIKRNGKYGNMFILRDTNTKTGGDSSLI